MLEFYEAYADYTVMMSRVEESWSPRPPWR